MQIRFFFILACLMATTQLKANERPPIENNKHSLPTMDWACNYPAPTNFMIDAWGYQPDWVHLKWDLTNPNRQHRINVYSCEDSSLIRSVVVSANVTDTTLYFYNPPLNIFYYEIKAICTSGDSPNSAWINCWGPTGTGIIHDLIVSGITPLGSGPENCTLRYGFNHRCYFSNTETTTFRIQRINNIQNKKSFTMLRIANWEGVGPRYELDARVHNGPPSEYTYQHFSNGHPPVWLLGTQYEIHQAGRPVATLAVDVDFWTGESYLKLLYMDDFYEIIRVTAYNSGGKPAGERDENPTSKSHPATVSPNPFKDVLDVFPGNISAEHIRMQMYNLSGQILVNQLFEGGKEQYSLPTGNLSPGFYLLRIESDGEVQTLKVIKSE